MGSNLGDREAHLSRAERHIASFAHHLRRSGLYETAPLYNVNQPAFLNCVLEGYSEQSPRELLLQLQELELQLGRDRDMVGWKGPRTIDIDILLYGKLVVDSPDLAIPHPGICERKFVLVPLLELEPTLSDPITGKPYKDCLDSLHGQLVYSY